MAESPSPPSPQTRSRAQAPSSSVRYSPPIEGTDEHRDGVPRRLVPCEHSFRLDDPEREGG